MIFPRCVHSIVLHHSQTDSSQAVGIWLASYANQDAPARKPANNEEEEDTVRKYKRKYTRRDVAIHRLRSQIIARSEDLATAASTEEVTKTPFSQYQVALKEILAEATPEEKAKLDQEAEEWTENKLPAEVKRQYVLLSGVT